MARRGQHANSPFFFFLPKTGVKPSEFEPPRSNLRAEVQATTTPHTPKTNDARTSEKTSPSTTAAVVPRVIFLSWL